VETADRGAIITIINNFICTFYNSITNKTSTDQTLSLQFA